MPGPREQDPDEVQQFLHIMVDDLLRLWKDGVRIVIPQYPEGRLVRVALVGIVCDKPAAHKLGGYGAHSHRHFCTLCWAEQKKKEPLNAKIFQKDGEMASDRYTISTDSVLVAYPRRTNEEHRQYQQQYKMCKTDAARAAFVKKYATCWSEFSHLPYFNFEKMVVVDPMHNLFLGMFFQREPTENGRTDTAR